MFLETIAAERNAAANTISSYRLDLQKFDNFCNTEISLITQDNITKYLNYLSLQGMEKSTIARKIVSLRQFFKFLREENIISNNPMRHITPPKFAKNIPTVISKDEMFLILSKIISDTSPRGIRNWTLFELLYGTGMRASELVSLKLSDLKAVTESFSKNGKIPSVKIVGKGGSERYVPLHETCVEALLKYFSVRSGLEPAANSSKWLFPSNSAAGHITRQRLHQLIKQTARDAGVNSKVSPHVIRHAFATHLLNNGANLFIIQKLLGHADISTTQIYTHVQSQKLLDLIQNNHPLCVNSVES
jgi:integrase/recombinase XerD